MLRIPLRCVHGRSLGRRRRRRQRQEARCLGLLRAAGGARPVLPRLHRRGGPALRIGARRGLPRALQRRGERRERNREGPRRGHASLGGCDGDAGATGCVRVGARARRVRKDRRARHQVWGAVRGRWARARGARSCSTLAPLTLAVPAGSWTTTWRAIPIQGSATRCWTRSPGALGTLSQSERRIRAVRAVRSRVRGSRSRLPRAARCTTRPRRQGAASPSAANRCYNRGAFRRATIRALRRATIRAPGVGGGRRRVQPRRGQWQHRSRRYRARRRERVGGALEEAQRERGQPSS